MGQSPAFSFSARISGASSEAFIHSSDGESVAIPPNELPTLMIDLAAGGPDLPGRSKHHARVLAEWFTRKKASGSAHLRLVV